MIPSFKENDNCAQLRLPKQFKFWVIAVAASFTFRFCGSLVSYSGSLCAFKARLRLKWFTRSEVFRPNTQITVTWAGKVADISIPLSSILLGSSRLCINEESQTAGRTLCEIHTDTMPCALPDQTQMLYSPEYSLSTSAWSTLHLLCFLTEELQVPASWITFQCVKRKGWEHRCFCLSSSNTDSFPASVCLAFSSLCCAGALLSLSKHLFHFFVQLTPLSNLHLTDLSTCSLVPPGCICWVCSSWILSPCFCLH